MFGETVAPVAHPTLGLSAIQTPQVLEAHVLLEFDGEYRPWLRWNEWLVKQGWEEVKPKAVLWFNQYDQAIHAAIARQGMALGRMELLAPALADGRLTKVSLPNPGPITSHAYWLIRISSAARSDVEAVVHWINEEAESVGVRA